MSGAEAMLVRIGPLPESALDAAAAFHAEWLPRVTQALADGGDVLLVFAPADHAHRAWRLAVVQGLARDRAPARVNAVASEDETAIAEATAFLARAAGVTGQYFPLDGAGAGNPAG